MVAAINILIPTYRRPAALAVTLTSLVAQTCRDFRIVISDQTEDSDLVTSGEVQAVIRVLRAHGHIVEIYNLHSAGFRAIGNISGNQPPKSEGFACVLRLNSQPV